MRLCVCQRSWNVNPAGFCCFCLVSSNNRTLPNRASVAPLASGRIYLSHKVIVARKAIGSFRSPERAQQNAMFVQKAVFVVVWTRCTRKYALFYLWLHRQTDVERCKIMPSMLPPSVGEFVLRLSSMQSSEQFCVFRISDGTCPRVNSAAAAMLFTGITDRQSRGIESLTNYC